LTTKIDGAICAYIDKTKTPPVLVTNDPDVTMTADGLKCQTKHLTEFVITSSC
jgi:hypothetical protein